MFCPVCQKETETRNHNGRGHRCTVCWSPVRYGEQAPAATDTPSGASEGTPAKPAPPKPKKGAK